jgi:hypothetical protein
MSRIEIIFGSLFEIHLFYLADKQRLLWFYIKKEVELDLLFDDAPLMDGSCNILLPFT